MADVPAGTGQERQKTIENEQHRPEQNEGYDEAARGGPGAQPTNVGIPMSPGDRDIRQEDAFDRAEREAANDVRRRDRSAD
jgi:hypothetical protein